MMVEPKKVLTCIGLCSYKGPDVHCFDQHYEFMHYLGRLQERSYWMNMISPIPMQFENEIPRLDRFNKAGLAELTLEDPIFEFCTATVTGNSLIGQARDRIVERALEFNCDYVLFFDDDMLFARDAFLRLWRHHKPFVGALAFTAREPIAPVIWRFKRTWNFKNQCEDVDMQPMFRYEKNKLIAVDAVGTGLVLIQTDVFRKIPQPWFNGAVGAGEDVHFCWQCHKAGIPVFCDTSIKTIHRPNQPAQWHDEEYYLRKLGETNNSHSDIPELQTTDRLPLHADPLCGVPV